MFNTTVSVYVCVRLAECRCMSVYHCLCIQAGMHRPFVCRCVSRCAYAAVRAHGRLREEDKVVPAFLHSPGTKGEFHVPLHSISCLFCWVCSKKKERKWILDILTDKHSRLITKCKHWFFFIVKTHCLIWRAKFKQSNMSWDNPLWLGV